MKMNWRAFWLFQLIFCRYFAEILLHIPTEINETTEITVAGQRWTYTKLSPLHLVAVLHQNQQIYLYTMPEKVKFY